MTVSSLVLFAGLALLFMGSAKNGNSSLSSGGAFLISAGITSLTITLVGGGTVSSIIVLVSVLLIISGSYITYVMYSTRKTREIDSSQK